MPSLRHHTESLERLKRAFGLAKGKGHTVVRADGARQTAFGEQLLEGGDGEVLAGRLEGFAQEQEAGRLVGDGQRVTVAGGQRSVCHLAERLAAVDAAELAQRLAQSWSRPNV